MEFRLIVTAFHYVTYRPHVYHDLGYRLRQGCGHLLVKVFTATCSIGTHRVILAGILSDFGSVYFTAKNSRI